MPGPARSVLALGLIFLLLGLLNAALATTVSPELQRAEVLNGLAAVALMLVAALWTRADPKTAERVVLPGEQGLVLSDDLTEPQRQELAWGSQMLLTATPASTLLVHWNGSVILRRGLLGSGDFQPGTISRRAMERETVVSLVNTTLFPGRSEFDPVLEKLPAVIVCPLGGNGVVILGGWSVRCFSQSDERWLQGWAERLKSSLMETMNQTNVSDRPSLNSNPDPT